ncbi:hypothetical protein CBR_g50034 [Chara braunii]|uniref:Uncharacterized protein n=1 Tax=Chara braunii TaxID=69332 RepID=A0A388M5T2_CHABU|nr:hypothetical protein CBR_g50034 [Chara braunii]|eukprot:GBG89944.1 hypothetical protein CBR_g50034 [Chara braunii]
MVGSAPVIGIDLGTSFCCVAVYQTHPEEKVEIIANDQGHRTTPSFVAFDDTDSLVGEAAQTCGRREPEQCIYEVKRLMGRAYKDVNVELDRTAWPFKVEKGPSSEVLVGVDRVPRKFPRSLFKPEEISAMLLRKMKKIAEDHTNEKVTDAVITVPAYFNNSQREATIIAAKAAGLNVLRLMNEPTAAALAYGHLKKIGAGSVGKRILVFDLGGGTLDVSIITVNGRGDDPNNFLVSAVAGDGHLGGADFDKRLLEHLGGEFRRRTGVDVLSDRRACARLKEEAVKAKLTLSSLKHTEVELHHKQYEEYIKLTRVTFERLNEDYFARCLEIVQKALTDARITKNGISQVLLVGGSTRIPRVQQMLRDFFGNEPLKTLNADEAVAYGAAVYANYLSNLCAEAHGLALEGPTAGAIGVKDVTPRSIGVKLALGQMHVLIPRNTPLPATASESFSLAADDQTTVRFELYEGERALTRRNRYLGKFELRDFIPTQATGQAATKLTVNIDEDGILLAVAEATLNHANKGETADLTINSRRGTLNIEEMHTREQETRMEEGEEEEDAAIREAFEQRGNLRRAALEIRQRVPSMSWWAGLQASKKVSKVVDWLKNEQQVSTKEVYEKKLRSLERFRR